MVLYNQKRQGFEMKEAENRTMIPTRELRKNNHEYFYLPFLRFIIFCLNYF